MDGTTRIWDSVTGQCLAVFQDHMGAVFTIVFSPDTRLFATAGRDGQLNVYDIRVRGVLQTESAALHVLTEKRAAMDMEQYFREALYLRD